LNISSKENFKGYIKCAQLFWMEELSTLIFCRYWWREKSFLEKFIGRKI